MSAEGKHPVLIVDDEPDVLFSLKGLLRREFTLHTAESGEEALQILKEHPVHVIMTDQRMPGMSGVELMQQVRESFPEAIRIVFTGYADIKAVVKAINSGGLFRYITKPWDPDELIETLKEAAQRFERDVAQRRFAANVHDFANATSEVLNSLDSEKARELSEQGQQLAQTAQQLR
ncbi:MAG: hypothetical protein Fues2KO_15860 [Fuerstiella sp.]